MKIEYLHNYKISIVVFHQKRALGEIYRLEWFDRSALVRQFKKLEKLNTNKKPQINL